MVPVFSLGLINSEACSPFLFINLTKSVRHNTNSSPQRLMSPTAGVINQSFVFCHLRVSYLLGAESPTLNKRNVAECTDLNQNNLWSKWEMSNAEPGQKNVAEKNIAKKYFLKLLVLIIESLILNIWINVFVMLYYYRCWDVITYRNIEIMQ